MLNMIKNLYIFMQKSIAKQTDVKNKNSIGLKTMSFFVYNDENL